MMAATSRFPLDGSSYALAFSGSGAFISSDGYVLTADHVVDYTNNDQITLDFFNAGRRGVRPGVGL